MCESMAAPIFDSHSLVCKVRMLPSIRMKTVDSPCHKGGFTCNAILIHKPWEMKANQELWMLFSELLVARMLLSEPIRNWDSQRQ